METVICDLCGHNDYEILQQKDRFNSLLINVVCRRCGLVYINPRMDKEQYKNFNIRDYRRIYKKPEEPSDAFIAYQLYRGREIFNFLSGYIRPNPSILDVNCTVGGVLASFKQRLNCEIYGTETALKLAQYATRNFNVKIFNGLFEDNTFRDNFFDLIIMAHVLEHAYSPTYVLEIARRILKNSGLIYIEVPNILRPRGKVTSFFQAPHPYTFSLKTLSILCQKIKLEVIKHGCSGNIHILLKVSNLNKNHAVLCNGHYLEIIKAVKAHRVRYFLYLRYLNFLEDKFNLLKGKIKILFFMIWETLSHTTAKIAESHRQRRFS